MARFDKRIPVSVFGATAEKRSSATAVEAPDGTLTYGELDSAADATAAALHAGEFDKETPAAVFIPNSAAYVTSILGVQKACGIFMPADPDAPLDRQARIFARAAPDVVMVDEGSLSRFRAFAARSGFAPQRTLVMAPHGPVREYRGDGETERAPVTEDRRPEMLPGPDDGLYVMFTSGTTGDPKAILGSQKGLAHFIDWECREFGLDGNVRASNLAPTTFDVSLRDIFAPLAAGGTVVVPHGDVRNSPAALLDWLVEKRIGLVHIVPGMFRLLLDELEKRGNAGELLADIRHIMLAGEPVYGRDVLRFRNIADGGTELVNLYGPSETTLAKLYHRLDYAPENPSRIMPLGRPISNTAALIIKNGRLAEIGEIGEIYIKTPFGSKGYFRDPELTAGAFVANPLTGDPGDIVYRTGDMGRYREDRSVEFAGRLDRQVKVNGVRVELNEVDEVVGTFPGIGQALVMPHSRRDGEVSLTCYYTGDREVPVEELRNHLSRRLYSAMIPSFFVRLDAFPLGINGKIDRRALPRPDELIYGDGEFTPPETKTESAIAAVWSEILGIGTIGVTTPFNVLGGGSMQAIRCVGGMSRALGVDVALNDFFANPTVRELAALVDDRLAGERGAPIPRQPDRPDYPATHSQKRHWMLMKMIPGFTAYNISGCFRVLGDLDENAFESALRRVLRRHEILRTVFFERDGEVRQRVLPEPVFHLEQPGHAATGDDVRNMTERFGGEVFDLERGPLFRAGVIEHGTDTLLVFAVHHIICDAWSLDIVLRETMQVYTAAVQGRSAVLPEPSLQYRDFAAWQAERLENGDLDVQREFWLDRLDGELPRLDLPLDARRPPRREYHGASYRHSYPEALLPALRTFAGDRDCTVFPVILAALRVLLYRYSGQAETVLNSPVTLRGRPELETIPGDLTNTVLLRGTVDADMPFSAVVDAAADDVGEAMANREYPFDLLAAELDVMNDLSRAPVSDVGLTLVEDFDTAGGTDAGLLFEPYDTGGGVSKYDLVFHFSISADGLAVTIEYDTALFDGGRIRRMAANLGALLAHGISQPGTAAAGLDILDPAERAMLDRFRFPRPRGYPDTTIHGAFAEVAAAQPDACALVGGDGAVTTYAELEAASGRIASLLLSRGCRPGDRVAVHLPRGPRIPEVILGILRAGCVYVPLPDDLPGPRMAYILDDCGAAAVCVSADTADGVPGEVPRVDIGDARGCGDSPPPVDVRPGDGAYIIYTSGSTGNPKGVLLPHAGLVNRARDLRERIGMSPADRCTQFASLGFDASLYELFTALLNGASLVTVDRSTIDDPGAFAAFLQRTGVTFTLLPPTYLRRLERRKLPGVRVLFTAGEAADPDDALHYAGEMVYVNAYGPTEDSVCSTMYVVDPAGEYPLGIPIGDPVGDTEAMVLDNRLAPVPVGVPGELCVSDRGLATGYLNLPELTAAAFVPHPRDPGGRMYRTGDLVRWREDGTLLFLGRRDNQVKIGGHRIEPGEIESVMRGLEGVTDACVVPVGEGDSLRLAAYHTGSAGTEEMRASLAGLLPRYMIPHYFTRLDTMPVTVSGKIDRKSLPDPVRAQTPVQRPASTAEERDLLAAVGEILGDDGVGPDDNFFVRGGDSIRAIQVVSRLREKGWSLTAADVFEKPVIADLARVMRLAGAPGPRESVTGPVKPTPILRWFAENVTAQPEHFNQAVMLKTGGKIDPAAFRSAFRAVWRHHDALRMVCADGIFSILPDDTPAEPESIDLDGADTPADTIAAAAERVQRSFDLASGPLLRAVLFRHPEGDRLLLAAHHLVVDAVTWQLLARDLEHAYAAASKGESVALPPKTHAYRDWSDMLNRKAGAGEFDNELPYWKGVADASCDSIAGSGTSGRMRTIHAHVCGGAAAGVLAENTAREPVSRMLAALACSLNRWKGADRVRLVFEGHGRSLEGTGLDISRTAGWFTAVYPFLLACGTDIGRAFDAALNAVNAVPGGGIGYGVLRYLAGREDLDAPAEISFNWLGRLDMPGGMFTVADEPAGETVGADNDLGHVLEFLLSAENDRVDITLSYDDGLVGESEAESLLVMYRSYLEQAADCHASGFDYTDFGEGGLEGFLDNL